MTGAFLFGSFDQQPAATDESIRGVPATEPLAPVVAPLAADPVMQGLAFGNEPGCVTTGEPEILGTFGRDAAFGLAGLTAPGIADCVDAGLLTVPGILLLVPTDPGNVPLLVLGEGVDGATPGEADPGDIDGAVARPVDPIDGAVPVPLAPPLETPDEPVPCA